MLDSKQDTFFDENKENEVASSQLLAMMNSFDKKIEFNLRAGDKVTGTVTKIGSAFIFVDIQAKNEAVIKRSEFEDDNKEVTVNPGDKVQGFIVSTASDEIIMSKSLSAQGSDREGMFDAYQNKVPVSGKVTAVSKDGLTVKLFGNRAFCPISQIDTKYTEDVNAYLGKTLDFVITRLTEGGKNIVISRIPLLEEGLIEKINQLENAIEPKTVFQGVITKIADFGLFVAVNDVEGLVHISELSWEHIAKPSDIYSVGQHVDCLVLKVVLNKPLKNSKISLSIKQVSENPWNSVTKHFSCGQSVQGKVVRLTNFGAFIELLPGVDGLVHISEMSWVKKINHPSEVVTVGNMVNVNVIAIDPIKKSISLSLKDVASDPWSDADAQFPTGKEVNGTVSKKSRYGYFIDLADGITGLLVFSNINAEKKEDFKEGDIIPVNIVSVDRENRRISLAYGISSDVADKQIVEEYKKTAAQQPAATGASSDFGSALLAALGKKR